MRSLIVIAAAVLAAGLLTAPAQASGELGLSWDGKVWASQLNGDLFDSAIRWVPGDERTEAFYLRNQANSRTDLAISVESADPHRLLDRNDISVSARVGDAGWVSLDRVADEYPLSTRAIAAGDVERVQVRATFDPASTNQSQRKSLDLDFRVVLSDAGAGSDTDNDADDNKGPNGILPDTGAPAMGWALLAAAGMMGTGLALVRRSRDEEVADV